MFGSTFRNRAIINYYAIVIKLHLKHILYYLCIYLFLELYLFAEIKFYFGSLHVENMNDFRLNYFLIRYIQENLEQKFVSSMSEI